MSSKRKAKPKAKAPLKIERLYAFVSVDEHGNEGIMAEWNEGIGPDGRPGWLVYIGADMARVDSLRPHVMRMVTNANAQGKKISYKIKEFTLKGEM